MRTDQENESAFRINYVERINRAIDHIVRNLAEPLRLEEVAETAGFSPFHFHRVFKCLLGETLNQFVKRLRLGRPFAHGNKHFTIACQLPVKPA